MENASYALIMAASILIACMLIALVVFVFNNLSGYQQSQDDVVSRESITEFNKKFESYDKTLMYGTDVLSCLNLAQNNNQVYVYEVYQGQDTAGISYEVRDELIVQVHVTLNSALTEEITVSYKDTDGSIKAMANGLFNEINSGKGYKISKKLFSTDSSSGLFTLSNISYYYFTGNSTSGSAVTISEENDSYANIMWGSSSRANSNYLKNETYETKITAGTYNLVADNRSEATPTARLIALLSTVTNIEQTVYNDSYSGYGYTDSWYMATWISAAYDFKTRKFKCIKDTDGDGVSDGPGIEYNDSGYVCEIWFCEV